VDVAYPIAAALLVVATGLLGVLRPRST
jgi:hypothetical protein